MRGHIAIAVGLLAGCSSGIPDFTEGERGKLEFDIYNPSADPGDDCFIGCGIERSLLVGTTERISAHTVADAVMPFLSAQSSAPDIVEVTSTASTCCNHGCREGDHYEACLADGHEARYQFGAKVTALRPGTAKLLVYRADGSLYERLSLTVDRASSLEVQVGDRFDNRRTVDDELALAGQHQAIRVIARDGDGDWMFANEGVTMELTANGVAAFYGEETSIDRSYAEVWPLARGTDMLTVSAAGATKRVSVVSE